MTLKLNGQSMSSCIRAEGGSDSSPGSGGAFRCESVDYHLLLDIVVCPTGCPTRPDLITRTV